MSFGASPAMPQRPRPSSWIWIITAKPGQARKPHPLKPASALPGGTSATSKPLLDCPESSAGASSPTPAMDLNGRGAIEPLRALGPGKQLPMPNGEWTSIRTGEMAQCRARANRERVELIEGRLLANLPAVDLRRVGVDVYVRMVGPNRVRGCEPLRVLHAVCFWIKQAPPTLSVSWSILKTLMILPSWSPATR